MESLQTSSAGSRFSTHLAAEDAIAEVKLQLAEEKNHRLDLEKELELQMNMRAENEVALKLLEKDIHEKQDTIVSLRKQLEDIKLINLEMFRKLQVSFTAFILNVDSVYDSCQVLIMVKGYFAFATFISLN